MSIFGLRLCSTLSALIALGSAAQDEQTLKAPGAERATFQLDSGLTIELVASEPQIESPVAMAFDENGRLWVVEMRDYPNGPKPGAKPAGRIKVLDDDDRDGFYERASIFADELLFANGLMPWDGGLIVTAAPQILFLKDEDGDGKADRRDVLWEGFSARNPQLRVSHPILGLDGWVYVVNGLQSSKVKKPGQAEGEAIDISGRDFKFNPRTGEGEAIAGMGQFGNTFDDWGRRFVCTNRNHIIPIIFEEKYAKRNPYLIPPPRLTDNQNAGGAARIFPISKNFTTSTLHEGSFSASCGILIYRGDALPDFYYGSAFMCDPTGNLVHQEIVEPDGAGFRWHPPRDGVEFLASTDDWFRPVFLSHGPDGALYVVDMYRKVIEHPEWMPPELQKRPDLELGNDKGRIWRILPEKTERQSERPKLAGMPTEELVRVLDHSNAWYRVTAQRLLVERADPKTAALLSIKPRAGYRSWEDQTRLGLVHAVWLLRALGAFDDKARIALSRDEDDARLWEQAILLSEGMDPDALSTKMLFFPGMGPDDRRLRFQIALSLGAWEPRQRPIMLDFQEPRPASEPGDQKWDYLARIAAQDADDPWSRTAILSSIQGEAGHFAFLLAAPLFGRQLIPSQSEGARALWAELFEMVGRRNEKFDTRTALTALAVVDKFHPELVDRWRLLGLAAMDRSLRQSGKRLVDVVRRLTVETDPLAETPKRQTLEFLDSLPRRVLEPGLSIEDSRLAIELLPQCDRATAVKTLIGLIRIAADQTLIESSLESLSRVTEGREAVDLLLDSYERATPQTRRLIVRLALAQPDRIAAALQAVESGALPDTAIDAAQVAQLINDSREEIRTLARRVLASRIPAERNEVLARYQPAVTKQGDIPRGRVSFRERCAQCHRVEGFGVAVGPDLSDLRTKSPEMLLHDILNPNAAIDANYQVYSVATKDGRVFSGLIQSESAAGLTLVRAEGQTDTILRQDIEETRATGQSLMPDGVEKDISPDAMADLIAYLKNWRYEQAGIPKGK